MIKIILLAITICAGCSSNSPLNREQVIPLESCSVADAEQLLKVVWMIPSLELFETNKLGFKKTNKLLITSKTTTGIIEDWHRTGRIMYSLSPRVIPDGVKLTFKCEWRDSEGSGQTNALVFIPFEEDDIDVKDEIITRVQWLKTMKPNHAPQGTARTLAAPDR